MAGGWCAGAEARVIKFCGNLTHSLSAKRRDTGGGGNSSRKKRTNNSGSNSRTTNNSGSNSRTTNNSGSNSRTVPSGEGSSPTNYSTCNNSISNSGFNTADPNTMFQCNIPHSPVSLTNTQNQNCINNSTHNYLRTESDKQTSSGDMPITSGKFVRLPTPPMTSQLTSEQLAVLILLLMLILFKASK